MDINELKNEIIMTSKQQKFIGNAIDKVLAYLVRTVYVFFQKRINLNEIVNSFKKLFLN